MLLCIENIFIVHLSTEFDPEFSNQWLKGNKSNCDWLNKTKLFFFFFSPKQTLPLFPAINLPLVTGGLTQNLYNPFKKSLTFSLKVGE